MAVTNMLRLTGTLTRTSAGAVDAYNNPTEVTTTASVKCWVEQAQRDEVTVNAAHQTGDWKVYLHPDASPVSGHDRLTVNGTSYELVGPPWEAVHPITQTVSHIEASARVVA